LRNINEILGDQICGQERSRLLTFIVALSSKTKYPLAIILVGDPGTGRTRICDVVLVHFTNKIEITSASGKALEYLPEESIAGMILYVDETVGAKDSSYALRTLLSEGRLVRMSVQKNEKGKMRTETMSHSGKIVFLSTTNNLMQALSATNNRILIDYVDQSPQQLRKVLKWLARRSARPGSEEPSADPTIGEFLIEFSGNREIVIPFLDSIAEKLPVTKSLIVRPYRQLEYLIKQSALVHESQRIHVRILDADCVVADPVDFLYARDLLGEGGITKRMDRRMKQVYEWMQVETTYTTHQVGRALEIHQDTARKILDALANVQLVFKDESQRTHTYTKEAINPEDDPLKPQALEGYGLTEDLKPEEKLALWVDSEAALITFTPLLRPVYVNPLIVPDRRSPIGSRNELIQPDSTQISQIPAQSTQIVTETIVADEVGKRACLHCHTVFPDDLTWSNHLATMPKR
jgi:hypothetical protein